MDSLTKAMTLANNMVNIAHAKAAELSNIPAAISGASTEYDMQSRIHNAAEQYKYNRDWVYACVRLVSQRVAGQPIRLARRVAVPTPSDFTTKAVSGLAPGLEPVENHPLLDLLADPWELGTAWSLIYSTVASLELTGRAVWYVTEENGRKTIFPVPTSWVVNVDRARTKWEIRLPGAAKTIDLPGDQVVYFHYPDPENPWGALSPLQAIASAVVCDASVSESQRRTFSQGQFPGHAIIIGKSLQDPMNPGTFSKPELTPEQKSQIIASFRRAYQGLSKQGEPLILDGMIESVERLSLTPDELSFLESSGITKSRILQGFGVSPILLGQVEGANRASATVADDIFCGNKINPLLMMLSQTMTEWLGPMFAAEGEKLVLWIEPAQPNDPDAKSRDWNVALTKGAATPEEYRKHVLGVTDDMARAKPTDSAADPAATSAPTSDVQATALNGAQIASLLQIIQSVADGTITPDSARAIIAASFPLLSSEQIAAIIDPLKISPAGSVDSVAKFLAKRLDPYSMTATDGE